VPAPAYRRLARLDELSTGRGLRLKGLATRHFPKELPPASPASYTVQPGDSYYSVAQNQATAYLAQQGLSPSDPAYSAAWHRLSYRLVQELMASNGSRMLRPGDQLLLPDPAKLADPVPSVTPPSPETPSTVPPTNPATPPSSMDEVFVNQLTNDPSGGNANCGFTSSLMALRLLGIQSPAVQGNSYEQAMALRRLGGGGTNDSAWGTVGQVVTALNAAGAHATTVPYSWGADKMAAVEVMRQAFLSGQPTAFVVAGNPALGWPDKVSYDGGHFVTVAGYDPASNTFTVLDPISRGPMQVTPDQLAAYLRDGNAEAGELVQVRP
jgi:hypothetical protein